MVVILLMVMMMKQDWMNCESRGRLYIRDAGCSTQVSAHYHSSQPIGIRALVHDRNRSNGAKWIHVKSDRRRLSY